MRFRPLELAPPMMFHPAVVLPSFVIFAMLMWYSRNRRADVCLHADADDGGNGVPEFAHPSAQLRITGESDFWKDSAVRRDYQDLRNDFFNAFAIRFPTPAS